MALVSLAYWSMPSSWRIKLNNVHRDPQQALVAASAGLTLLGALFYFSLPPRQLRSRRKGPDRKDGETTTMDYDMYDRESLWWNDPSFALYLVNSARIPFFTTVWLRELDDTSSPQSTFLDVGCGGGIATEALAGNGFNMVGIDPSEGAVKEANRHAVEAGVKNVRYEVGSAFDLSFPDDSVHGVVSSDVLEHLDDLDKALSEVHRVLRPGGIFVFDTINRTLPSWYLTIQVAQNLTRILPRHAHDWRLYITPSELKAALRDAGFEIGDEEEWRGMRPGIAWPHMAVYRGLFQRKGFVGLVDQWKQCKSMSCSYLGWARKPKAATSQGPLPA